MFRGFLRIFQLIWITLKYELDDLIYFLPGLKLFSFFKILNPFRFSRFILFHKKRDLGQRVANSLESFGPIFVKFGQILSTRRDILSPKFSKALSKLQDHVRPFSGELALSIIQKEMGDNYTLFKSIDLNPIASASIAQVHQGELSSGEKVAIKVIRPTISKQIKTDFKLLLCGARIVSWIPVFKRLNPIEVVKEIQRTVQSELDLTQEASNASVLRRNEFKTDSKIINYSANIPKIVWPLSSKNILVMEYISGIPLSQLDIIQKQFSPDQRKIIAEQLIGIFYKQVFFDNFFHADLHPGNILISKNQNKIKINLIDCGIIGSLTESDNQYLAQNFLAFFKRDYRKVSELHIESKWVPEGTCVIAFESALRSVCEPIFEREPSEVSCAETLIRLFQVAGKFKMEAMPQLLLLQKTLLNIEGVARSLYPEIDLWKTAQPILEYWMKSQYSFKKMFQNGCEHLPKILNYLIKKVEKLKNL